VIDLVRAGPLLKMMRSILRRFITLARRHGAPVLVLVSVVWVTAALVVATRHGARRRATFNGGAEEVCNIQVSAPTNR